jgi:serine O-acetyltransferase
MNQILPITGLRLEFLPLNDYSKRRKRGNAMADIQTNVATVDPVWDQITQEAQEAIRIEPLMGGLVHACILHHRSLEKALSYRIAAKLTSNEMSMVVLRDIADQAYNEAPELVEAARADLMAVFERDPASHRLLQPILYFKGYQAMQAYRIGHWLWTENRHDLAYFFQMRVSEIFGIDIHPAARIGKGIMIDHAHSIVIGETAVVGDNVSMLHSVTLGGTGKEEEDRHPKIADGVLIGAGAKVLGNISIGRCSRIAAGSVVLSDVPACKTVAGVPARIVGEAGCEHPSVQMDQMVGINKS